jgi:RNA polymerase sigma factor (sigma-70 family)
MNAETLTKMLPALIAGDECAWERVFVELYNPLVSHARKWKLNPDDAHDCAIDALLNCRRAIINGDKNRNSLCPTYFYSVVARDAWRRLENQRRLVSLDAFQPHVRDTILEAVTTENGVTKHDVDIEEALRNLDDEERSILWLRYGLGLKLREVAERLGITLSCANTRLQRILEKMRFWLDDHDP